jgi:hypothetical protein
MGAQKTIFLMEVTKKEYNIRFTGGFKPDWDHLSPRDRKAALRHYGRICDALIACPDVFEWLAGVVKTVERFKRREEKKNDGMME